MRILKIFIWAFFIAALCACSPQKPEQLSPQSTPPSDEQLARRQLLNKPFLFSTIFSPPTVNTLPTVFYNASFPKAPAFNDYNQKNFKCFMAVNFGWPFESDLPKVIRDELKQRNLLSDETLDIFWVIQPLSSLGGNSSGADLNITYLKAHGWADPDGPLNYVGTRLQRDFLYGLYDADVDISYEVKNDRLTPFEVHIHDGMFSPQTAAVKMPAASKKSIALWTLVIDHKNPTGKVRAIATLHWLISDRDEAQFLKESFKQERSIDSHGVETVRNWVPRFKNVGEYITMLKTTSVFKNTTLVKKLLALVGPSLDDRATPAP